MRDLLISLIIFGILPFIFSRPHYGIFLWTWIGLMNPHRMTWGFAYSIPFAQITAIVTIISFLINAKKLKFFWSPTMGWLILFNLWMLLSTFFAIYPEDAWVQWEKVFKIQLFVFLTLFAIVDRKNIHVLVWLIAFSIGFFGLKGGIFTLTTGGVYHVLGPGGFIEGNTEIGLALVMILPLVWYLYLNTQTKWIRYALLISMLLIAFGILGTQSRGALLGIMAVAVFLWLKSSRKAIIFIVMLLLSPFAYMTMPESWHDRMSTIKTYKEDESASQRLIAWEMGYTMARARPWTGGGFESASAETYERFTPHLTGAYHDYHSIYIEILAEHGFVGLFIFLMLFWSYWRTANKIIKITKSSGQDKWASDLAAMLQVSFVGYAIGGAFLGLAYFDLFYLLLAILIITLRILEEKNDQMLSDEKALPS